jgi:hypothetical protein
MCVGDGGIEGKQEGERPGSPGFSECKEEKPGRRGYL